jgi:hypothetical protein
MLETVVFLPLQKKKVLIQIRLRYCPILPVEDYNLRRLIRTIYPDHQHHSRDAMYLMQRSILAPKNIDVDEVNNAIFELLFEELHTYLSADSLVLT